MQLSFNFPSGVFELWNHCPQFRCYLAKLINGCFRQKRRRIRRKIIHEWIGPSFEPFVLVSSIILFTKLILGWSFGNGAKQSNLQKNSHFLLPLFCLLLTSNQTPPMKSILLQSFALPRLRSGWCKSEPKRSRSSLHPLWWCAITQPNGGFQKKADSWGYGHWIQGLSARSCALICQGWMV